jgi:transcriptional regulator with XRE-family HTH domain
MEKIKRLRKARGLSLSEVARLSGLFPEAIARAEREGQDPRASTLSKIARALGVPICELFEESGHGQRRAKQTKKA